MSLFGSWVDAASFNDLQEIKDAMGMGRQVWQAFTEQVGDPANDVRLLSALPRVAVVTACGQAQFPDDFLSRLLRWDWFGASVDVW